MGETPQEHETRMKRWGKENELARAEGKLRPSHLMPAMVSIPLSELRRKPEREGEASDNRPTTSIDDATNVTNSCPACGGSYEFDERQIGQEWNCPLCGGPITLHQAPLTRPIPEKSAIIAGLLGALLGPFGMFYAGWRYGLSAICFFVFFVIFMEQPDAVKLRTDANIELLPGLLHLTLTAIVVVYLVRARNRSIHQGNAPEFADFSDSEQVVLSVASIYAIMALVMLFVLSSIAAVKCVFHSEFRAALGDYFLGGVIFCKFLWWLGYAIYGAFVLLLLKGCEFVFCRKKVDL